MIQPKVSLSSHKYIYHEKALSPLLKGIAQVSASPFQLVVGKCCEVKSVLVEVRLGHRECRPRSDIRGSNNLTSSSEAAAATSTSPPPSSVR